MPALRLLVIATLRRRLPPFDPAVAAELRAMHERLRTGCREAIEQQVIVELRRADAAQVFDALDVLRSRPTG